VQTEARDTHVVAIDLNHAPTAEAERNFSFLVRSENLCAEAQAPAITAQRDARWKREWRKLAHIDASPEA